MEKKTTKKLEKSWSLLFISASFLPPFTAVFFTAARSVSGFRREALPLVRIYVLYYPVWLRRERRGCSLDSHFCTGSTDITMFWLTPSVWRGPCLPRLYTFHFPSAPRWTWVQPLSPQLLRLRANYSGSDSTPKPFFLHMMWPVIVSSRCFKSSGTRGMQREREHPPSVGLDTHSGAGCLFNNDDKWRPTSHFIAFPFSSVIS